MVGSLDTGSFQVMLLHGIRDAIEQLIHANDARVSRLYILLLVSLCIEVLHIAKHRIWPIPVLPSCACAIRLISACSGVQRSASIRKIAYLRIPQA